MPLSGAGQTPKADCTAMQQRRDQVSREVAAEHLARKAKRDKIII
jgi:hypothetical protein